MGSGQIAILSGEGEEGKGCASGVGGVLDGRPLARVPPIGACSAPAFHVWNLCPPPRCCCEFKWTSNLRLLYVRVYMYDTSLGYLFVQVCMCNAVVTSLCHVMRVRSCVRRTDGRALSNASFGRCRMCGQDGYASDVSLGICPDAFTDHST